MNERIKPFENLSDFSIKTNLERKQLVKQSVIDQVAADNNFLSRQVSKDKNTENHPQRRYRTGRNQQINIKATSNTIEKFYRIADNLGMPLGAVLDLALDALEKEN